MKFWISKNPEIPVREQLVTQVMLAIASGELGVGDKLPSTAEIARRFKIHANTVSHAYQELSDDGWIELRPGSGFYVRDADADDPTSLERFVAAFLRRARELGYTPEAVRDSVASFVPDSAPESVLLLEDDDDYRLILVAELEAALSVAVESVRTTGFASGRARQRSVFAAMFDERPKIAADIDCVFLKTRSVADAMAVEHRPGDGDLIAIASGWDKFLWLARTMLVAARIDPESLIVRSTRDSDWRKGIDSATMIICDAPTAKHFAPDDERIRPFRLIADESIAELRSRFS